VKNVGITFRTFVFTDFCTPVRGHVPGNQELEAKPRSKSGRGKITKSGGSDPTLRASSRPKKFLGSRTPLCAFDRARDFSAARSGFQIKNERTTTMPLIKKAPALVSLEVKIEEPVKQLLEDYARFIESTPDHVVNIVIKKNLCRDQDYRKWREQQRADSARTAVSHKG
jgi:hypothetical protein